MTKNMQKYYDHNYYDGYRKRLFLSDYSLLQRTEFFQQHCIISKSPVSVLDFGCGTGALLTSLKGISLEKSFGVDISKNAIDFAKNEWPDFNWRRIDIDDVLPFRSETFDCVISSEVIEHVFDVDNFLKEIWRVLKPEGVLGLSCPFHGFLKDLLILLSGKFEQHFHDPYDPHIRYYTMKGLKKVLNKNKFNLIETKAICPYYRVGPLARMVALAARKIE